MTSRETLTSPVTDQLLWTAYRFAVRENRSAHASPDVPDSPYPVIDATLHKKHVELVKQPDIKVVKVERRVEWSDLGQDRRVHHSVYVKYAHDAASELSMRNRLNQFSGDLATYRLSLVTTLHGHVSRAGDVLTMNVWEDDTRAGHLNVHICEGSELVCQVCFEYDQTVLPTLTHDTISLL